MTTRATAARKTTTQRGLGWQHQQQTASLKRKHVDGTACWWCSQPMYRDAARNFDGRVLEGDHTVSRAHGGTKTDRLLHGRCNGERGDGSKDNQRPAITGQRATTGDRDRARWCILDW